jgi:hypothetical protein
MTRNTSPPQADKGGQIGSVKSLFASAIFFIFSNYLLAIPWPIAPFDSVHPLGNNWGEYQNYGGSPYFHNGIDIITVRQQGVPVYAVAHGWVKAWLTIQAEYHWRLAIADSNLSYTDSCEGWLYAHIDSSRFHKNIGDEVQEGDLIGYLVPWPVTGFDHLHFARIKDAGSTWDEADWAFVQNPLTVLDPNTDTIKPQFENARTGAKFAFCRNNSNVYLNPESLYGDIDIIAKICDKTGFSTGDTVWDRLAPYRIEYSVRGDFDSIPLTLSFQFSGLINQSCIRVVYKTQNPCRSRGDYDYRDYYFIVTNTDGDSILETTDSLSCWHTADFPDGWYYVKVTAYDIAGNSTTESMPVFVFNGVGVANNTPKPTPSPQLSLSGGLSLNGQISLEQSRKVSLKIFDNTGRMEKVLISGQLGKGDYHFTYQTKHSGIYFLVAQIGGQIITKKVVIIR